MKNVIGIKFFSEVRDELKKVIWPTKAETIRLTTIVLTASIVVGFFIGSIDLIFAKIFFSFLKV